MLAAVCIISAVFVLQDSASTRIIIEIVHSRNTGGEPELFLYSIKAVYNFAATSLPSQAIASLAAFIVSVMLPTGCSLSILYHCATGKFYLLQAN